MKTIRNEGSPKTSSLLLVAVSNRSSNVFFFFCTGPVDKAESGLGGLEVNELGGPTEDSGDGLRRRFSR
jgi:hypothetical protein